MPLTPLFDPEAFFRKRPDPSLLLPTAIVFTNGILPLTVVIAYTIWPGLADIARLSEFTMTFANWDSMRIAVGLTLTGQLVAWWLDAAVMYLVSAGGSGDYSRLLAYTGGGTSRSFC